MCSGELRLPRRVRFAGKRLIGTPSGAGYSNDFESDRLKRMALDLETLRTEIQAYLDELGVAVFYGYHRMPDTVNQVAWDAELHPDFRAFVSAGQKAGAKLFVFHHQAFSLDQIDEALDELEESDFTRDEKRNLEARLRQLKDYEGFTCSVELSFCVDRLIYMFELHTEWYDALAEILAELEVVTDEEGDDGSLGGYFSNN